MTMTPDEGFEMRSCKQKVRYISRQEAQHFVRRMSQKKNTFSADSKKIYKCRYCLQYHTGAETAATKAHKRDAQAARQHQGEGIAEL